MPDTGEEAVEIEGFERQLNPEPMFFPKRKNPTSRYIELPIEMWMHPPRMAIVGIFFFVATLILVFSSVKTYDDIMTDAWSTCSSKKHVDDLHGSICHRGYVISLGMLIFVDAILCFGLYAGSKLFNEIIRIPGPHLRLTRNSFWCYGLAEPIMFSDVVNVDFQYSNVNRRGEQSRVTFFLDRPLELTSGAKYNLSQRNGEKSVVTVRNFLFDPSIHGVFHAASCLAKLYRQEHAG